MPTFATAIVCTEIPLFTATKWCRMRFLEFSKMAAAVTVFSSVALAQPASEQPRKVAPAPSIKLTYGYNPLQDESNVSSVVTRAPRATIGSVSSIINTGTDFPRDQERQYVCEVIWYMDGTKVLRVGELYIELRGVGFEETHARTCAIRQVLSKPRRTSGDDITEERSNFETCPAKLASVRGRCQSDKDTCCTRPSGLISGADLLGR